MKALHGLFMILTLSASTAFANPVDDQCVAKAKEWIFSNSPASSTEATRKAVAFCKRNGNVSCLNPTFDYIFKNSNYSLGEVADQTLKVCVRFGNR